MAYQAPLNGGRINATIAGNTAGVGALVSTGTLALAGGNNITLSQAGSAISISGANQSNQTLGIYATGASTTGQSSSNTIDARSFVVSGQGMFAGMSGNTLQLSAATTYAASNHSHGNPTLNLTNMSGTTASASDGLTLSLSAASQTVQTQSRFNLTLGGNSTSAGAGYAQISSGTLLLAGGNNITLSQNGNSVSIVGGAGGGGGGAAFSNSETYFSTGTINLAADGPLSIYSAANQSFRFSVAPTSSVSATGALSISTNGATISMGVPAFSAGISNSTYGGTYGGTTGTASNQVIFAAGSNITLSQSTGTGGNTVAIYGPGAGGAAISAAGNSVSNGTLIFSNSNGIGFGMAGSTLTASHNGLTSQSNQVLSASNGSFAFQTAGFSNANGVTFGTSAGSIISASVNTSYAASNHSHGNPTLNLTNLSGTTASASNGLTLSLSAASQTAQTQSVIQGVIASGSTNRTGDISFANSNNITFGLNNNTITASFAAAGGIALANSQTTFTNGTANLAVAGGALTIASTTGQSFNFSVPSVSSLNAAGNISISTAGTGITISASTQSNQVITLNAATAGNTFSSTSGTADASNLAFRGYGNVSVGATNGSVLISASGGGGAAISAAGNSVSNGTVIFSNANGVSFGMAGSTVTGSVAAAGGGTISNWEPVQLQHASLSGATQGAGSVFVYKLQVPANVSASQFWQLASITMATANTLSHAGVISQYAGLYSASGSTLSLITGSSGSTAYQWTVSGAGSIGSVSGIRGLSMPLNAVMSPGNYYLAMISRTSSTNANSFSASQLMVANLQTNLVYSGILGQAANNTQGAQEAVGNFSATSAGLPASMPMSQITQNSMRQMPYIAFKNATY